MVDFLRRAKLFASLSHKIQKMNPKRLAKRIKNRVEFDNIEPLNHCAKHSIVRLKERVNESMNQ